MKTAVCSIIKNEPQHYLDEWIEHNFKIGFDKIYIYNNGNPIPKCENVIIIPWPGQVRGIPAYNDFFKHHARYYDWVAVIDGDEFITIPDESIKDFLQRFTARGIAGIGLNWRLYGSSEQIIADERNQSSKFRWRLPDDHPVNRHIKCIVRPEGVTLWRTPHKPNVKRAWRIINSRSETILGTFTRFSDLAFIRHYFTRSYEEWLRKVNRGRDTHPGYRDINEFFRINAECIVYEPTIQIPVCDLCNHQKRIPSLFTRMVDSSFFYWIRACLHIQQWRPIRFPFNFFE